MGQSTTPVLDRVGFAMLSIIMISVLVTASSVFGTSSNPKGVSIPLQERGSPLAKDGVIIPEALARLAYWDAAKQHAKINNSGPPNNSSSLFRRHSAPLESKLNDILWVGEIEIGKPRQRFRVDFDTGSADTWVFSSTCVAPICSSKNKYVASESSTSTLQVGEFKKDYFDGTEVSGPIYADTITVAGLSAEGQWFSPIDQVNNMEDYGRDGLMGLSFMSISQLKAPTFIGTLLSQKKISKHIFSMRLSSGSGSELFIGGINPSKYRGELTYVPLESQTMWIVKGSASANGRNGFNGNMVIDSGTALILGAQASVVHWWSKVPGSKVCPADKCKGGGFFMFPCTNAPRVTFEFGGREFPIAAEDFNLGTLENNSRMCVGAIRIANEPADTWNLGVRFMKNVYTVFDVDSSRIGFATPA
ncbi:aspartic protease [Rhizoctonia solani AG-3 Rhs1AP]|uniref:Aspartic protease n=1 Tax=Rhizoctonia solani AG-3 Rhs1AP TaxID=1086054 RepID=X8IZE5_9AGAM|nr:aspartic protease [Rhizoctonia solani AG-3 Rhs1AP]